MSDYFGTVAEQGDSQTFYIKLLRGESYIIDLVGTGATKLADPTLSLIGDNGQFSEDDNGGAGRNSQIFLVPNRTQYYEISASGHEGSTGDFELRVNMDDYRNGRTGVAPAGEVVTNGRAHNGTIDYAGDSDAFALSLIGGLTYNFRMHTRHHGHEDPRLVLLSADGHRVASDDDSGPDHRSATFSFRAHSTGAYWLLAQSENHKTGDYAVVAGVGHGTEAANHVTGSDGNDAINVLGGDDRVRGGLGNDQIWGASGNDRLYGDDGNDRLYGGLGEDRLHGDAGSDRLYGEDQNDHLYGDEGNDQLDGGGGDDGLSGGTGRDIVNGGAGNDSLYGGAGGDQIQGDDGDDRLSGGSGGDYLNGGLGNDRLIGGEGSDNLDGGDGDNRLSGGGGGDWLTGGSGNDTVSGGSGNDYVDGGDGDNVISGGAGDDYMYAGDGNDRISGGKGSDQLQGGDGNDALTGGRDGDGFYGGDGRDTFIFKVSDSEASDPDTIWDFEGAGRARGDWLDYTGFDADRTAAGIQTPHFGEGTAKGAIWVEDDTAKHSTATLVFANIDNDSKPEFMVKIEDGLSVTASDYTSADFLV